MRRRVPSAVISWGPEPPSVAIFRQSVPSQQFQNCRDAALIRSAGLGLVDKQGTLSNLADRYLRFLVAT
jgi:hypothetical protein